MGYSKSKKVVRQFESYLIQLVEAKSNILFPNKNPTRLGQKLREAIYASQFHDDVKKYANLLSRFQLRIKSNGILAEIRDRVEFDAEIVREEMKHEIVLKDVVSIPGIIGAIVKHKGATMSFPDFDLTQDLTPLDHFCKKLEYTYTTEPHLTVTKND